MRSIESADHADRQVGGQKDHGHDHGAGGSQPVKQGHRARDPAQNSAPFQDTTDTKTFLLAWAFLIYAIASCVCAKAKTLSTPGRHETEGIVGTRCAGLFTSVAAKHSHDEVEGQIQIMGKPHVWWAGHRNQHASGL